MRPSTLILSQGLSTPSPLSKRLFAEFLGTFWLVLGGCGSATFAAKVLSDDPTPVTMGIGFAGAPEQLWLFWVAPIVGAIIAGAAYGFLTGEKQAIEGDAELSPAAV